MTYAVVVIAGFQQKVAQGDTLDVPSLAADAGATVNFDQVLLVSDGKDVKVGTPTVAGASVSAEVVSHGRGDKISVVKFRRRKRYHKTAGHRQPLTTIKITKIAV